MSRLSLPAVKFYVTDLAQSISIASAQPEILGSKSWRSKGRPCDYSIVWVQGTIIQADTDVLLLDDDTGIARVDITSKKLAKGGNVTEGSYVMVIGELQSTSPAPLIKAMKVQELPDASLAKQMWPLEITDIHQRS